MKSHMSVFARSVCVAALAMAAGGGCASEPVVGNDPSRWELPAVDTSDPFRMTVERLLELSAGTPISPPQPDWSEQTTRRIGHEQAGLYIAGVLDSGEQDQWCIAQSGIPPHEVDQALLRALAGVPGHDNAAAALRTTAASQFPCQP